MRSLLFINAALPALAELCSADERDGALVISPVNPETAPHLGCGSRIEFGSCATNAPPLPLPRRRVVQGAPSSCGSFEKHHDSMACPSSIPLNAERVTYGISRKAYNHLRMEPHGRPRGLAQVAPCAPVSRPITQARCRSCLGCEPIRAYSACLRLTESREIAGRSAWAWVRSHRNRAMLIGRHYSSKANTRFQSFFMLMTVQLFCFASSYSACVNLPTLVSGSPLAGP
jgi:hypothetical protein